MTRNKPDPREHLDIAVLIGALLEQRPRASRIIGSAIFLSAGLFYIFAPPMTTTAYFDTSLMNIGDGFLFAVGGIISGWGAFKRRPDVERLGVALVVIAGIILVGIQTTVMLWGGDNGITWTRGGGTMIYAGFTAWAYDRWRYAGHGIRLIQRTAEIQERNQNKERVSLPPYTENQG